MVRKGLLSVELVRGFIEANFNRFFRCRAVVDLIIADRNGVSLKFLLDCKKRDYSPYEGERVSVCGEVTWVLKGLKNDGYIEKYNNNTWMVVK